MREDGGRIIVHDANGKADIRMYESCADDL